MAKRTKLSGQGEKLFFSQQKKSKAKEDTSGSKKSTTSSAPKPQKTEHKNLIEKIKLLKSLVEEFKKLEDPGKFKSLNGRDLKKY